MDYLKKVDTAHSTYSESAPLINTLKLTKGRLVGGFVFFPSGPAGLLHLRVERGISQILPSTPGESYALDNAVVPFHLDVDIVNHPLSLDILTWNDSTTFDHSCTICLFLDPLVPPRQKRSWLDALLNK